MKLITAFLVYWQVQLSFAGSDIGSVRCYVCKSSVFQEKPIRFATNCSDINNISTTTIKYCRACLSYVGGLRAGNVTYATIDKPVHIRTCYDGSIFNLDKKDGIFQTSAVLIDAEKNPDEWVIQDFAVNKESKVELHKNAADFFKYGPGILTVCNDQDLCNSGWKISANALLLFTTITILVALKLE